MFTLHDLIRISTKLISIWLENVWYSTSKRNGFNRCRVTGVPDSSISAAIGFAEASGIPYEMGLIKNRYIGRTFIQPTQELRERGVKMKLSPVVQVVRGKKVIMVNSSIVRGTTSRRIVKMLKEAGAKEVHVTISSPPISNPCFYGIDISSDSELIATGRTMDENAWC